MKKALLLAAAVVSSAFTSCTHHEATFWVQEPQTGTPMHARYRKVGDSDSPADGATEAMTRRLTGDLSPEQLGREYFPAQEAGQHPMVSVAPYTGMVPGEKRGWLQTSYLARVTVRAKASREGFQQTLKQINMDFYRRALRTGGVARPDELPAGEKPALKWATRPGCTGGCS
ncbi:MAG: hypothetical protein EOP88_20450 [Verrucomicrobiaceae bacterium]|nr:MAG: hypothetical protein EOP88_20450 [Verrucomicrobiaceae bacterium]